MMWGTQRVRSRCTLGVRVTEDVIAVVEITVPTLGDAPE
jgi:hypothetical protein